MRSLSTSSILSLLAVATVAWGLDRESVADPSSEWKLQIDLDDGSRIVGSPEEKTLDLDIEFDRLQIPFDRVRNAQWLRDHRSVRVELKNRDVITGRIKAKHIAVSTLFGDLVLKTAHMKMLEVIPANRLGGLPSERDLVLYYSFDRDGGGKVVNHAADRLHGRATNVYWTPEGRRGGAVTFNGNSSVEIPHHEDLCPPALTMAVWICPNKTGESYEMVIAKTDSGSWSQGYGLVRRSGEPNHLTFFVNHYSSSGAMVKAAIGKWSHIAGVFDGECVRVYLNGNLAGTAEVAPSACGDNPSCGDDRYQQHSNVHHTNTAMFLGRNTSGYNWSGKMDELVIYSRALEPAEVKQLYLAGTTQ